VDFRNVTHGNYQERLEREFNMTVITTVPNVSYHAFTKKDPTTILIVNNPSLARTVSFGPRRRTFIKATIITKSDYVECNEFVY
jgi:GTP-binding protein LepA